MKVSIAGLELKNPVIAASGTFGFGREYSNYMNLSLLGGIAVKALTLLPRQGNKAPRIAETPSGILNSVGLQNPGVHAFIKNEIPFLRKFDTRIIVNISGNTADEYAELAKILSDTDVDAIEVNVSCPNVACGGVAFGNNIAGVTQVAEAVCKSTKKPVIVKLTPNVTDIAEIAKAAEAAGAHAVSLINTLLGMSIDIHRRRPMLGNNTGGLSGPAIRPIAVRMVYETYKAVTIPVIGMGGIASWEDAVEFLLAGASAVMIGTANFMTPDICLKVIEGIQGYMTRYNFASISDITGKLELN
jgi:dihydroorotate dehydrogenase (NAD+) catalytic subunit